MSVATIDLLAGSSRATIAPSRGAIVTRWSVAGDELFYLDEETFRDASKNVRGGNPVLFPSPGKLTNDRYARGALKQHGFARTLPWEVVEHAASSLSLALSASDATRANYPWEFRAELRFVLSPSTLRIDQRVTAGANDSPMPFGFGFHPYFSVPDDEKHAARIETSATRAFDNVHKKDIDLHGIDLASGEVDLHLLDHNCSESALSWFGREVRIHASADYRRWVIWTLPGKDFVCLEPWTCPDDALNTREMLIELLPGASWEGFVEYTRNE
jgi:galactose mutarotase-like enzyme